MTGEVTAEQAKKREEDAENKSDIYFLMGLMGIIIFLVAAVMVCCLDLFGRSQLTLIDVRGLDARCSI